MQLLKALNVALRRAFKHDVFGVAKAAAYSSILMFFPALLVLGSVLASSRKFEVYVAEISYALRRILPAGSATALEFLRNTNVHSAKLLTTALLLTIWTASSAIVSWMEGFRKAYQLPQTWGLVKERLIACLLVILAGIPMTFATILVAFGSQIENLALAHISHRLGPLILLLWTGIRWAIATSTSIAVISVIYHKAVPYTRPWHHIIPGAILATGLWFTATWLFGWYLRQSTEYSVIYGFLAVGIALLVWMYVFSLIVLIGAEFNAVLYPHPIELRCATAERSSFAGSGVK